MRAKTVGPFTRTTEREGFRPSASLPRLEEERLTTSDPRTNDRDKRGRLKSRAKGTDVGFRLTDPEGATEPTALIHDLLRHTHDRHPDGRSTLTFELLPRTNR